MAGEKIGDSYEALIKIALDSLKGKSLINGEVFWNEKPIGITVNPDFTIGLDKDHPSVVIMSTHSTASKNSDMKCWRNIGELCEMKPSIDPMPFALNILFDATFKDTLLTMQEVSFDKQLIVEEKPYGSVLIQWIARNAESLPKGKKDKVPAIIECIRRSPELSDAMSAFEADLLLCLSKQFDGINHLWSLDKARSHNKARDKRLTFIRRGLSKLLVFEDIELAIRIFRGKRVLVAEVPRYAFELRFVKESVSRVIPLDPEIIIAFNIVDDATIRAIYHSMDGNSKVGGWIHELRNAAIFRVMGDYVCSEYDNLCNHDILHQRICELYSNPTALVSQTDYGAWPPNDVWLVSYMIELFKAFTNKANGYGSSKLADDVVAAGFGTEEDKTKADQFGGGLGFLAWLNRADNGKFRPDLLDGVAHVLSQKLTDIKKESCSRLITSGKVTEFAINNLLESKLCCYRIFDPIFYILQSKLKTEKKWYRTCFGEVAELTGTAGKVRVEQIDHTIIKWQSGTEKGHDHKRNELCGRAIGLRYSWDSEKGEFIKRPGVEKLILIIDGYWSTDDIISLTNCGWDEIYYPDEIEKLKAAIV